MKKEERGWGRRSVCGNTDFNWCSAVHRSAPDHLSMVVETSDQVVFVLRSVRSHRVPTITSRHIMAVPWLCGK